MSELNEFSRAELLLGKEGIEKLRKARVAVFGIGGVGSFAAEALARGGVGHLALVDGDVVSLTNINRQLIATQKTIGRRKTSVMAERIHEILPETEVVEYPVVYGAENRDLLDFASYDYIVDAIDTVTSKLILIEEAKKAGTEVISSMGTGNLQNKRLSAGEGDAEGIEGARHSRREGGLFQGAAPKAGRIAGDGQTTDSRKSFLCAAGGRADSGRRGHPAYCRRGFGIRKGIDSTFISVTIVIIK